MMRDDFEDLFPMIHSLHGLARVFEKTCVLIQDHPIMGSSFNGPCIDVHHGFENLWGDIQLQEFKFLEHFGVENRPVGLARKGKLIESIQHRLNHLILAPARQSELGGACFCSQPISLRSIQGGKSAAFIKTCCNLFCKTSSQKIVTLELKVHMIPEKNIPGSPPSLIASIDFSRSKK